MCSYEKPVQKDSSGGFELADIFREHMHSLPYATDEAWKVINAITACRTEKLGGHIWKCTHCNYMEISYNSCRNRHCPKCQGLAKARWILKRDSELLPVTYFHVVFTIPSALNDLTFHNQKTIYSLFFKAASETLKVVIADPKHLGAATGFFSILHTWDQRLNFHPHIHFVVPGGGLSPDKTRWISSKQNFLVPVRILSRVFRGKFMHYLEDSYNADQFVFSGNIAHMNKPGEFKALLFRACKTDWVVYSKTPFNGSFWVMRYLARYTHRIAISNSRIISCQNGRVVFQWHDRKNGYAKKLETLDVVVFMQRFLLHVLPHGFMRIRYYGFMGNTVRNESIALIRDLLGAMDNTEQEIPARWVDLMIFLSGKDPTICPICGEGHMIDLTPFAYNRAGVG